MRSVGFWRTRLDRRPPELLLTLIEALRADPSLDVESGAGRGLLGPRAAEGALADPAAAVGGLGHRQPRCAASSACCSTAATPRCSSASRCRCAAWLDGDADTALTGRRVARQLRAQFARLRAARIGPDLSHRRTIVTEVLRTRAVRAAVAQEVGEKSRSSRRRAVLLRGAPLCQRDRGQLLARLRDLHVAGADAALEPAVRRRRVPARGDAAAGGRGQRDRLRALPSQPHGLSAAVLRDLPARLCHSAHRRRPESEPADRRPVAAQGRRVLHPPQLARQRALHDRVHEVPRGHHGARPFDRVLHRRRPQPHRPAAAAEDRHAVDDGAQLPARAAPAGGVPAGVFRLRAHPRRRHLHRRALRQAQGEGVGAGAAAQRRPAVARAPRPRARQSRRADPPRCAARSARAGLARAAVRRPEPPAVGERAGR